MTTRNIKIDFINGDSLTPAPVEYILHLKYLIRTYEGFKVIKMKEDNFIQYSLFYAGLGYDND